MPNPEAAEPYAPTTVKERIAANQRRAATMVAEMAAPAAVLVGLLAWAVAGLLAAVVAAVVVAVAVAVGLARGADAVAQRLLGAVPADPVRHARLLNLVGGLCVAAGVPRPDVRVVDDPAPDACAFGRDPHHAVIVVTQGLLDCLTRVELEGVMAHELSHVKAHDTRPAALAVVVWGLPGLLLRPLAAHAGRAAGGDREPLADLAGVRLTRYPPGLVAALEKLVAAPAGVRAASPATAALWIRSALAAPPMAERIETLREL
jgi:heat shock protein HtpX